MIEKTGGAAMTRYVIQWVAVGLILCLFSCSQDKSGQDLILARINDYALTLNEFNTQLKEELEYDKDFKLNHGARKTFLDQIITKELLIQEAKRRQLDREDKFIRAIERYWEATLIRDLMAMEGQAIEKRTVVSQEEIEARYGALLKSDPNHPPLASLQDQIAQEIINEKKQRSLEEWIGRLKTQAKISVNESLITDGRVE
jgi:peptidyl-prolyl cis-trans isomerase C